MDVIGLFDLTPVEIEWKLAAFAACEQRRLERMDEAAWLVGRYVAIGLNAPRRYPRRPDAVKRRPRTMSDDEMKRVFAGLAERKGGVL